MSLRSIATLVIAAVATAAVQLAAPAAAETGAKPKRPTSRTQAEKKQVSFNQHFVEGLASKLDLNNEMAVFGHVFGALPAEVVVYPTENYYYWSFMSGGRAIWGNFRLDAGDRDQGVLHLGYFEYDENGKFQDYDGWDKRITAKDGVVLKRVARLVYAVTYKGKTVTFRLNDIGMAPPKKAKLRADEVYVGPVFDESGVKFFLIFNKTENHFHYLLNEDGAPSETYKPVGKRVLMGRRTGFAYFIDAPNNRKILIAINGENTRRNNYYDGPFDQLPDNYVDQTNMQKYLELAYPYTKGKIDKFGVMKEQDGSRVAIGSYYVYRNESELRFVESCRKTFAGKPAKFYACITPDSR